MHLRSYFIVNIIYLLLTSNYKFICTSDSDNKCEQTFQVNKNTIIRTQDSKNEGAKYLDETEKDSFSECMKWCCQTTNCTVAVFEENIQGSCYLFDCGTPEKMLCKFTPYGNYTSGVMSVSRHAVELEQWGSSVNHLRKSIVEKEKTTSTVATVPSTVATTIGAANTRKSACGWNQFECRNDSSCIAIYNVCDGIYQCVDRSDEADGLGCPPSTALLQQPPIIFNQDGSGQKPTTEVSVTSEKGNHRDSSDSETVPEPGLSIGNGDRPQKGNREGSYRNNYEYRRPNPNRELQKSQNIALKPRPIENKPKDDSLFYHKNLNLIPAPENYPPAPQEHHQLYNHRLQDNARIPAHVFQSGSVYDGRDYEDSKPNDRVLGGPARNVYREPSFYATNDGSYRNNNYNGVLQQQANRASLENGHERYGNRQESFNQYGGREKYYGNREKVVIPVEDYRRPNSQVQFYNDGASRQRIAVDQPIGYDFAAKHELPVDLSASNTLNNRPYLELSNQQRLKPAYPDAEKENFNRPDYVGAPARDPVDYHPKLNKPQRKHKHRTSAENNSVEKADSLNESGKESSLQRPKSRLKDGGEKSHHLPSSTQSPVVDKKANVAVVSSKPQKSNGASILDEVNLSEIDIKSAEKSESSGALLALSLGLVLTGILVVLVGCRLRVVRRRILRGRNGRSPLAHDADYLVNGMYL